MSKTDPTQIPHELDLTIDYVNTLDVEAGEDALQTPASLRAWLVGRGLLASDAQRADEREHERAIELREALRELMLANNGGKAGTGAWDTLERAAREGDLGLHFDAGGHVRVAPTNGDVAGALARVLVPVADAKADSTWARAKVCPADDCTWAFYDRSRNRSAVWCEMAVCGNRTKVRAYRDRSAPAVRRRGRGRGRGDSA